MTHTCTLHLYHTHFKEQLVAKPSQLFQFLDLAFR